MIAGSLRVAAVSLLAFLPGLDAGHAGLLGDVSVSPAFFNPSIGQLVRISIQVEVGGELRAEILDRDGFQIRQLEPLAVQPGTVELRWDGKDGDGEVAPDEAYFPRLTLQSGTQREVFDPLASHEPRILDDLRGTYSRISATIAYELPRPARVHIQAGQVSGRGADGKAQGPVLKTVVDREPRVGGRVIETWTGNDESGRVYVPDLPHFAIGILATTLPDAALITVGNRNRSFVEYALAHRPAAAVAPRNLAGGAHGHHSGLSALEDRAPRLSLSMVAPPAPGAAESGPSTIVAELSGPTTEHFLAQPTTVYIFVDERETARIEQPTNPVAISLPLASLDGQRHRVVANWGSSMGPAAVGVLVVGPDPGAAAAATRGGSK